MNAKTKEATKSGVKAALKSMGYNSVNDTPPALRGIEAAANFNVDEISFARYLIYDTEKSLNELADKILNAQEAE